MVCILKKRNLLLKCQIKTVFGCEHHAKTYLWSYICVFEVVSISRIYYFPNPCTFLIFLRIPVKIQNRWLKLLGFSLRRLEIMKRYIKQSKRIYGTKKMYKEYSDKKTFQKCSQTRFLKSRTACKRSCDPWS